MHLTKTAISKFETAKSLFHLLQMLILILLENYYLQAASVELYNSLEVDSKYNSSAEKRVIWVSIGWIIVILFVPKAFTCDTDSLSSYLSNNALYYDFIAWDI